MQKKLLKKSSYTDSGYKLKPTSMQTFQITHDFPLQWTGKQMSINFKV